MGQHESKRQSTLDFLVANTDATIEEVEEQYNNFLTEYPDGKINKKGFNNMMGKCFPDKDIGRLQKHIFRMYDIDNDDEIDFREFMIVLYIMSNGTPEENLKQIFRVFDINNDGKITLKVRL